MRRGLRLVIGSAVLLVLGLAAGAVALFVHRNAHSVLLNVPELRFDGPSTLVWSEFDLVLGAGLLAAFTAGAFAVALLVVVPTWLGRGWQRHRDQRLIRELESELSALRNLPVTDPAPYEDLPDERAAELRESSREERWAELDDDAALTAALQDPTAPTRGNA